MDLGIDGKVALVLGASTGIGRGIAAALAAEGASVAMVSRSEQRLSEAAAAIEGRTETMVADTGDLDGITALPDRVSERLGPIDILVLNTGGPPLGGAFDNPRAEWEAAYRSLVLAPQALVEATVPGMRERSWGRIVNVASSSVREPIDGMALSNAHRMAAVGLLVTVAREVAADGITANTVATGKFATERLATIYGTLAAAEGHAREQVPAGRLGTPEEYGDLVAFLCSARAAYLTGAVIPLDGGLTRSP